MKLKERVESDVGARKVEGVRENEIGKKEVWDGRKTGKGQQERWRRVNLEKFLIREKFFPAYFLGYSREGRQVGAGF